MKKIIAFLCFLMSCNSAYAQITLDLKDAPIRSTIEMMFKQAGVKNYVIDNSVSGFITCNLTDLSLEQSLKIVMRGADKPLTYIKENDVWIVKERIITPSIITPPDITKEIKTNGYEKIHLNHIDPYDLILVLGNILFIDQFQRQKGSNGGSSNMGLGNSNGNPGNNNSNPGNQNGGRRP